MAALRPSFTSENPSLLFQNQCRIPTLDPQLLYFGFWGKSFNDYRQGNPRGGACAAPRAGSSFKVVIITMHCPPRRSEAARGVRPSAKMAGRPLCRAARAGAVVGRLLPHLQRGQPLHFGARPRAEPGSLSMHLLEFAPWVLPFYQDNQDTKTTCARKMTAQAGFPAEEVHACHGTTERRASAAVLDSPHAVVFFFPHPPR